MYRGAGGGSPQYCEPDEGVASRPRNSPFPKKAPARQRMGPFFPSPARVSGCTGQDGQKAEARSIPGLWGLAFSAVL